jgi:hypothetical protein
MSGTGSNSSDSDLEFEDACDTLPLSGSMGNPSPDPSPSTNVDGSGSGDDRVANGGGINPNFNSIESDTLPPRAQTPTGSSDEDFSSREGLKDAGPNAFGFNSSGGGGRLSLDDIGIQKPEWTNNNTNTSEKGGEPPPPPGPGNAGSPGSVGSDVKFQMIDQDTGEVYDIRDLESAALGSGEGPSGMEVGYTLMPSKRELMERKSTGGAQDSDDESSTTNGSGSKGKGVKSFFKGMKSKIKVRREREQTGSGNRLGGSKRRREL